MFLFPLLFCATKEVFWKTIASTNARITAKDKTKSTGSFVLYILSSLKQKSLPFLFCLALKPYIYEWYKRKRTHKWNLRANRNKTNANTNTKLKNLYFLFWLPLMLAHVLAFILPASAWTCVVPQVRKHTSSYLLLRPCTCVCVYLAR